MQVKWINQSKIKLTREMISSAKPNSIILTGEAYIEHPWFNNAYDVEHDGNLELDGRSVLVNFVIYRGYIEDWCIYHSLSSNLDLSDYLGGMNHLLATFDQISRAGTKLYREEVIRSIVDCSDEVFSLYRF